MGRGVSGGVGRDFSVSDNGVGGGVGSGVGGGVGSGVIGLAGENQRGRHASLPTVDIANRNYQQPHQKNKTNVVTGNLRVDKWAPREGLVARAAVQARVVDNLVRELWSR